ncbi:hypothetical protein DL766_008365 [Monosporascus sp. MC13-8B]|uniref:Sulfotransferase domain-containing protein n=1 Tax=Monosporascus cannonballus TaxID=155416 RepID=A0ABY0H4P3_9PEZI|nr:hypothetical protein DL763_011332 [Monosporascus cannonballus]RYO84515.1 hypothetical protein DL762_005621 [Monosporascus cannonballus]RYP19723.1 hypothetical protein DL766_008365 [Monosporascus sp. MC13-8B]
MSIKPVFVATHPRACSTAFERVFMTRRDSLVCEHEPFGDPFYYGPERLGGRFENDPEVRENSGFSQTTYQDILDRFEQDGSFGKRVFIKDMAYYLMPPEGRSSAIAPSVLKGKTNDDAHLNGDHTPNGVERSGASEPGNPTVLPWDTLKKFHFTFLIRHPRRAIPSLYRCCVPPQSEVTGFDHFMPNEAGYAELVRLFDYLRELKIVGPAMPGEPKGEGEVTVTVVDADDLLDHPKDVIEAFCKETGIDYNPDMLTWDDPDNQQYVCDVFAKWNGFHNDAINSTKLTARTTAHKTVTEESENEEWQRKYGDEAAKVIRTTVDENIPHYEYLKSFAMKF